MKKFTKYTITEAADEKREILIAFLSDEGIDGFEETNELLIASGDANCVNDRVVENYLSSINTPFLKEIVEEQNWNAAWESSFEPVIVGDFVAVRAAFHQPVKNVQHEIIITPKMSFGTGHHATTWLVLNMMRDVDFNNKTVLDYGTGTGVLAILAEKLGAKTVLAMDNDEWSINNATENIYYNNCKNIKVTLADHPPLEGQFDIILANINKHILLKFMPVFADVLAKHGLVILSGLLTMDEFEMKSSAENQGLESVNKEKKDGWIALSFLTRKTQN